MMNALSRVPGKRSFTLVEMVLVVTLIGIMMGSIIPSFRPLIEKTALKNTASTLSYILRYSRSVAIQRSTYTKITLPEGNGEIGFWVEGDPMTTTGGFVEETLPVPQPKDLSNRISIGSVVQNTLTGLQQSYEIQFAPNGSTADTLISILDSRERVYTLGIVGLTGQVMIWDHEVGTLYDE
ncbi:MAG: prepilin-type N-terminal cleavage/methylation domain-containing protein [bacterium]|nr:prepilin-type N-terminal cleavage/methylation domain-containing protein [bacterium]